MQKSLLASLPAQLGTCIGSSHPRANTNALVHDLVSKLYMVCRRPAVSCGTGEGCSDFVIAVPTASPVVMSQCILVF